MPVGFLLRFVQVFLSARLAQMQFFDLLFGDDLGDVQGCGLGTFLALHRRGPPLRARFGSDPSAILTGGGSAVKQRQMRKDEGGRMKAEG